MAKRANFAADLKPMMHGFGDALDACPETVDLMEDMVIEYITAMTSQAAQLGDGPSRVKLEDLLLVLRKDVTKFNRAMTLLAFDQYIAELRKTAAEDQQAET